MGFNSAFKGLKASKHYFLHCYAKFHNTSSERSRRQRYNRLLIYIRSFVDAESLKRAECEIYSSDNCLLACNSVQSGR